MNFIEFNKIFGRNTIIDIRNVENYFDGLDRRRLFEWQQKGYIIRITNNYYIFADREINTPVLNNIAAVIYAPSYVGLESALAYYNFIPEAVFSVVSLTTRRNKQFKTVTGNFIYRHIKPGLFFGYNAVQLEGSRFFISDPEKTLLDWLYFYPHADQADVVDSFRFNKEEMRHLIKTEKLFRYLTIFSSRKLDRAVKLLHRD